MAVSYKNGEIFDRAVCEKDVSGEYEGLDFEVTVKKGDNIIFASFGGGFTWGAIYLKWAYNKQ